MTLFQPSHVHANRGLSISLSHTLFLLLLSLLDIHSCIIICNRCTFVLTYILMLYIFVLIYVIQVMKTLADLTDKLDGFCKLRRLLVPLAKHVAIIYGILVNIGQSNPLNIHGWEHFEGLIKSALASFFRDHPSLSAINSKEIIHAAVDHTNLAILKDTIQ